MDKYNFIGIGRKVWGDWNNDGNWELRQVCTNVPEIIKNDTKINTISVPTDFDDAEPEEVMESLAYRADELKPYLSEFSKGYWCAIQNAINNGVGNGIITTMIRCAGLNFWDCYYLMKDSDFESERLKDIVHTMFCQTAVLTLWENKGYPTKVVTLFKGTEKEITVEISVVSLEKNIMDEEGNCKNSRAEYIDNQIFYYMNEEEFGYPDKDIIEILEGVLK